MQHIVHQHKSYKPCRNYATQSCEYKPCRFNHEVLQRGEQMCYKCGKKFNSKGELLNHIRNNHDDPCLKFIQGTCSYGTRCMFKHVMPTESNMTRSAPEIQITNPQVFPQLPTTGNRLVGPANSQENMMDQMVNQLTILMSQMMSLKKQ